MKRIATVGLACILMACSNNSSWNRWGRSSPQQAQPPDADARAAGSVNLPATNPAFAQRAVTDPQSLVSAQLAVAQGGPAVGKRDDRLQPVALFYGPLPTGLTISAEGRLFVCFPRWGLPVNFTVAEVANNQLVPFPDAQTNTFYPEDPKRADPRTHLVSVQSVFFDSSNRLWLLDTGSINMQPVIDGGPKMWGYDLKTGQRVKEITFGDAVKKNTYLNDVRFDLRRGPQGTAYITDSGAGGIIVVDLASGQTWRKLDGHPSVMADRSLTMMVEGQPVKRRPPTGGEKPVLINSDGIALSPDGQTLYYTPLTGHSIYAVPTDFLTDRRSSEPGQADIAVRRVADKPSANDGLICDDQGRLYTSDFERNAIGRFLPDGRPTPGGEPRTAPAHLSDNGQILVQDERILWPDTFAIHDGKLFFTANQLHRQADFHRGRNMLQEPFVIFQYPIDAGPSRDR